MIDLPVTLTSDGRVQLPGHAAALMLGYTKNKGVYRLRITASGEWQGLTIRCCWHVPGGDDPASTLVVDGCADVPASVTALAGGGCITFEGSDGTKTVTSADLRYRVGANSGTENGAAPEPNTPAWEALVGTVKDETNKAQQAKTSAETAAKQSKADADKAAESLQELKDGIANGNFKGGPGNDGKSPVVTVTDIKNGHRVSITDKDGTKTIDVLNGKAGKDGTQIDDTTVTDSSPWSSKHIVDMLCPPLEETGNPVVCYPVAGYPLGCKVSWEPTQEGTGDPSPENVRPISGRDSVTVERCGGNLLHIAPFSTETKNGVTFEYVPDGGVRIQGTASGNADSPTFPVGNLPPGNYYVLYIGEGVLAGIVVKRAGKDLWLNAKGTFKIIQGDIIKFWYMIALGGATYDKTVYPYIVPGTSPPTAYSPYTGQTATLTLPTTIYGGTVDAVTGEGNENAKIITLDGNELKFAKANIYINLPAHSAPGISKGGIICCSHFNRRLFAVNTTYEFCFLLESDMTSLFASVDELNAYCAAQYAAGTPVQIAYKLAAPVPFTATGPQPIPALSGINTALTDADSVTVTGRADPIKRIADLEDAVASMT